MTTSADAKPDDSPGLAQLPRTPASDLKKLGWKATMKTVRSSGTLLVTNHNEPEAVILAVAEYEALMRRIEQADGRTESALVDLRRGFDERLSVLQNSTAATRLRATVRERPNLKGKVKAGSGY